MSITAKLVNGTQKSVEVPDLTITVGALKIILAPEVDIPADEQRLVMRGKVLKDEDILSAVGMEHGNAIHVVRSKRKVEAPAAQPTPAQQTTTAAPASSTAGASTATPESNASAGATNPYASLFGSYGAAPPNATGAPNPAANPFFGAPAGGGFGAGGAPGMGGMGGYSPEMAMQMMQNPMMMQMAQQAMQDPQFMQFMVQNNPQLANMPPEALQQAMQLMQNPEAMQQVMALAGAMNGAGGFGQAGANPSAGPSAAPPSAAAPNFGNFAGAFAPPAPQGNPREIYRDQLQQLSDMGFPNEEANIAALQQAQGSVSFAIERLLNS